jgi:Hypothetical protein (DUF2513)
MKRDMDLVRQILITIEDYEDGFAPETVDVPGYTEETIGYHLVLMEAAGTICPFVFHRNGEASVTSAPPGRTPARWPAVRARWCMTCAGLPSGRSGGRACRDRSPCRSSGRRRVDLQALRDYGRSHAT